MKYLVTLTLSALLVSGCATTAAENVEITEVATADLPQSVISAIAAERPDFSVEETLKKVRDGRVYYDVEGELPDGSELEFDILMAGDEAQIVEIQRDLEWEQLPEEVQTVAMKATNDVLPSRIIESIQTDGAVIYELFEEGKPSDPAYEVKQHNGKVELLTERWLH